jgi:uncharacterized protein YbbC (DUF1343 family)
MSVSLGSDVLVAKRLLQGRTIGLVANPASVDDDLRHVADRVAAGGMRIGALFGPQHGFRSDLQENMIESPHGADARRSVPVYSLYSETREPTARMLEGLDALVIDLQDVGTRIYTYIYTMAGCLTAAKRHGLPVVVCDRPNPIGGVAVEGPMLEPGFTSFVGQYPIPMRHGMTIGELARLFNEHFGIGAKLEVVAMTGWSREQYGDETGLPWVLPSPNLPTIESAIVYPGTVLFEGTNVSEGRGTTRPFEIVGAPWVEPESFAAAMNARGLAGARFRRMPDPRDGSIGVSRGRDGRGAPRRVPPCGSGAVCLARSALRVRVRQTPDRYLVRLGAASGRPGARPIGGRCGGWLAGRGCAIPRGA